MMKWMVPFIWVSLGGAILFSTVVTGRAGAPESSESPESKNEAKNEAKPEPKREPKSQPQGDTQAETKVQTSQASGCLVDPVALDDIQAARKKNELKSKELAAKEAELKVKEEMLKEQLSQLEHMRNEISHIQATKIEENAQKIQQLTETILKMSPKAAAKVIATLDEQLAVDIMLRMDTISLAKVMNLMSPERSSKLSERIAGVVKTRELPVLSTKGGDANGELNSTTGLSKQKGS
jgi:flagellar motility protein MotE (MotC chaperone)